MASTASVRADASDAIDAGRNRRLPLCLCGGRGGGSGDAPAEERFFLDLVLQFEEALDQRLGPRRAARDVDINGNDLVDALEDRVVVVVEWAPTRRARPHGNYVLGLGHLLPEAANDARELSGRA